MPATKTATKTLQQRDFSGGINRTAQRPGIKDTETWWLENVQPIGPGQLRILAPPATAVATGLPAIASLWGVVLTLGGSSVPRLITIHTDGSIRAIVPSTGVTTVIGAAGTVSSKTRLSVWQDTNVLFADPTNGYWDWDGTTLTHHTTLGAPTTARDVAVFEGRVFLATTSRTLAFTAPNSVTDFQAVNGGGTTVLTDSAFPGSIIRIVSALELLWIIGPGAINSLSNLKTTGGVTTFTITNISVNVGTIWPSGVLAFFRSFVFLAPYGVYAILGATPQKLSETMDGVLALVVAGSDAPAAVFSSRDVFVWGVLVTLADPELGTRPVILCFARGAWFTLTQGTGLVWITSLLDPSTAMPQLWGTDGTTVFQCLAGTASGSYRIKTKFNDSGEFTRRKQLLRLALEVIQDTSASALPDIQITLENESGLKAQAATFTQPLNPITFVGAGAITFVGAGAITFVGSGFLSLKAAQQFGGAYIGLDIHGISQPYTLGAIAQELEPLGEWTG